MYAKVYNFKFPGLSEAKVAATFCSENLGKNIVPFNISSLNISIGKCGRISINFKFETGDDLNKFEENSKDFFQDLKKTFVFKQSDFSGIYVYNYESELTSTELSLN